MLKHTLMSIAFAASLVACGATQKAKEKQLAKCLGTEASDVAKILESSESVEDRLAQLTPDLLECAKEARAAGADAGAGSGSAR